MNFLRFNCNNRKFEKYAECEIIDSEGSIVSVNFKNKSIVIKDNKDLKNKTYKIYDDYTSKEYNEYYKEKIQKGKNISFGYVIIDSEKIFMGLEDVFYGR
jgi:hypothetical protein